jgi:aminoacrylate hydrolase
MFHPLFLYPPEYVNAHDEEITEEQRTAPTKSSSVDVSVGRITALLAFDRRAGLSRIKSPTLVMTSDNDYITPSYHAEKLAREIPGAKLVIPRGGGHSFSKTQPVEFNRIVLDFLKA